MNLSNIKNNNNNEKDNYNKFEDSNNTSNNNYGNKLNVNSKNPNQPPHLKDNIYNNINNKKNTRIKTHSNNKLIEIVSKNNKFDNYENKDIGGSTALKTEIELENKEFVKNFLKEKKLKNTNDQKKLIVNYISFR
jgi:hypothetical protein